MDGATIANSAATLLAAVTVARLSHGYFARRGRERSWQSRFEVREPFHGSAIGQAYLARDLVEQKNVLLRLFVQPGRSDRWQRELHAARRLSGPHTLRVLALGPTEPGGFGVVTEAAPGPSLLELVKQNGAFPVPTAARLIAQACVAVEEAHDTGVLHLGLQPGVLFLDARAGQPHVKVLDFGVARATVVTDHLATVAYMAPEVWSGGVHDHHADIYSLGAILYFLMTGRPPFVGNNAGELYWAHVHEAPRPPAERAAVPAAVSDLILWCLAKRPEDRPKSARVMVEALSAWLPEQVPFVRRRLRFARGSRPPL